VGAGKLSVGDAVNVAATLEPATLSFGVITATTVSTNLTLKITNVSGSSATFNFAVQQRDSDSRATVQVAPASVTLAPGPQNTASVTVSLRGSRPNPGSYEGFIVVTGPQNTPTLRVPYLYLVGTVGSVGSGVPADIARIQGASFVAPANGIDWRTILRVVDQYGVPVTGYPVTFSVVKGGASIAFGDAQTYLYGIAGASMNLGPAGDQIFTATLPGFAPVEFDGYARVLPAIANNGIVNAATFQVGQGQAPGSYVSIFGTALSDAVAGVSTLSLPVSLASASVSFDGGGLSLPGHLSVVTPGQINVQIPWEFQGQSSVQMKVALLPYGYIWSALYTVPLATYSPGIFAVTDGASGAVIWTPSSPTSGQAKRGGSIVIWANGLGPVDAPQSSGEPASASPLAHTNTMPTVTLGGGPTGFYFSGLTPGSVGLYQVNVSIPADAPTGTQPLKLSIGGQDATVNVVVQ
jgi:uncharacterized protein (TIGR03437 family)